MCLAMTESVEQVKSKGEEEKKKWHSVVALSSSNVSTSFRVDRYRDFNVKGPKG